MKRLGAILLLLAACYLLAAIAGCASTGSSGYYDRGTIHRDSFPDTYGRGSYYPHGRPGRYRY